MSSLTKSINVRYQGCFLCFATPQAAWPPLTQSAVLHFFSTRVLFFTDLLHWHMTTALSSTISQCNFPIMYLNLNWQHFFFSQKNCVYSYWKESFCTDKRRKFFHLLVHSPNSQSDQSFTLYMQKCNYKTTREIHFFSFLLTF